MASKVVKPNIFRRGYNRLVEYYKTVAEDYKNAIMDAYIDSKARPYRTIVIGTTLAGLSYAYAKNPTELDMYNKLAELRQRMVMVPNSIHNPVSDAELSKRTLLQNQKRLVYYDCYVFSLICKRPFDSRISTYVSQNKNLRGWFWEEFYDNIIDIGAFGRFYNLEKSFIHYDIREDEFTEASKSIEETIDILQNNVNNCQPSDKTYLIRNF